MCQAGSITVLVVYVSYILAQYRCCLYCAFTVFHNWGTLLIFQTIPLRGAALYIYLVIFLCSVRFLKFAKETFCLLTLKEPKRVHNKVTILYILPPKMYIFDQNSANSTSVAHISPYEPFFDLLILYVLLRDSFHFERLVIIQFL